MKYVHAYMYIHGTTKSFMIRDHADHSQVAELVLHCRNSYDHCTSILIEYSCSIVPGTAGTGTYQYIGVGGVRSTSVL